MCNTQTRVLNVALISAASIASALVRHSLGYARTVLTAEPSIRAYRGDVPQMKDMIPLIPLQRVAIPPPVEKR